MSNIVLDELDRELERRRHYFVRYADDRNIYVRSQRAGQRVMDHHSFHHATAQAQGERIEECGGATREAEVPGVQLQQQQGTETAHLAKGPVAQQAENPRTYATDPGDQPGTDDERTCGLLKGLEGILRLLSDTLGATGSRSMDPTPVAVHDLEGVETRAYAVPGVKQTGSEHHSCR